MKILWISDHPGMNTGYGKITSQTIAHLKNRGHEVLLMAAVGGNPPFQEQEWNGFRLWTVANYGNAEQIRYFLNKEKPDVVLANADPRFFDYLFKLDNEIRRVCPLVFYHLWDDLPFPTFNTPYYNSCDHIIAGSAFTRDLLQNNGIPNDMLTYAPIGFDAHVYKPLSAVEIDAFRQQFEQQTRGRYKDAKFIVGVVSRHGERKNLLSIMDTFNKWQEGKNDALLFVHSPGADAGNSLDYAMQQLFKDSNIVLSNAMPDRQGDDLINQFYNFFDVVVNRSYAEGFGMPIAEAMLAGTPAISIDCPGPAGLITSDNGWLLPADMTPLVGNQIVPFIYTRYVTDETFMAALDDAYYNVDARKAKAAKCRQYIMDNYSLTNMCRSIETGLKNAIAGWRRYPEASVHPFPLTKFKIAIGEE